MFKEFLDHSVYFSKINQYLTNAACFRWNEAKLVLGLAKTIKVHFLFETHLINFDLIQCKFLQNDP